MYDFRERGYFWINVLTTGVIIALAKYVIRN